MSESTIEAHARAIEVPYLLHFTRVINLPSIMARGLYPIARAHEIGAAPVTNDQLRLDGHRDGTSLSIAFPNGPMFYRYRNECADTDWVVLVIHPSVLWTKDCAFCRHNAADARISRLPLDQLKTPSAFAGMFEEIEGVIPRDEQRLKGFDPTDVQAEILVFDVIEPQYILAVVFEKVAVRDMYGAHLGERKAYVHANSKGMFASRGYVRRYQ